MRHTFTLALAVTLGMSMPGSAHAQDTRPGMAILPFENGGSFGKNAEEYAALSRGIPAILLSTLSQSTTMRLVDRERVQHLVDEQDLGAAGRVDAATAARVGQLVGARYMIAGTFIDLYGEFRIDARVIDVETGEILRTVRSNPEIKDAKRLFGIITSVATAIVKDLDLPPLSTRSARTTEVPSEAISLYSRALLYDDRGDRDKAVEYYRKAIDLFPAFTEARDGLRKASGG